MFVKQEFDYVPYSPRHQDALDSCVVNQNMSTAQVTDMEVRIRKEILDLASFR